MMTSSVGGAIWQQTAVTVTDVIADAVDINDELTSCPVPSVRFIGLLIYWFIDLCCFCCDLHVGGKS